MNMMDVGVINTILSSDRFLLYVVGDVCGSLQHPSAITFLTGPYFGNRSSSVVAVAEGSQVSETHVLTRPSCLLIDMDGQYYREKMVKVVLLMEAFQNKLS